jgi:hypothetical protein
MTGLMPGIVYGFTTEASWGYAALRNLGTSSIVVAQAGAGNEIYASGSSQAFWFVLRHNPHTGSYDQVYVSTSYPGGIIKVKVMDVFGDGRVDIVVASSNGQIRLFDQETRILQHTVSTGINDVTAADIADTDDDGVNEIVLCTSADIYVYSTDGQLEWNLHGPGGSALAIGQMDSDASLEVATRSGHVLDGATHAVQWFSFSGFAQLLAAADIDNDGKAELIETSYSYIRAYDVDPQLLKWTIEVNDSVSGMLVADVDGDGHQEIIVGRKQWGDILAFDSITRQQKWVVSNQDTGVTCIVEGDPDNDGIGELVWSAVERFSVADWQANHIEWQSLILMDILIGPEIGDLDGDGRYEMVLLSGGSDLYGSDSRILVFDAIDRRLRAISDFAIGGYNGVHDLKLRDVNWDGRPEILIATDRAYGGLARIYSFDGENKFILQWSNALYLPDFAYFGTVEAADIDDDQQVELIAGAEDRRIYVYSLLPDPSPLQWFSADLQGYPRALATADIDQDETTEIIVMTIANSNVFIFSGTGFAKELEATIPGLFTAMRVQILGGIPSIVLGTESGELLIYRYSSGAYVETYRKKVADSSIRGFTIDAEERIWISTFENGSGKLSELLLDGTILASYLNGDFYFGLRTVIAPSARSFYAAGTYAVYAFPLAGSQACSLDLNGDDQSDRLVWRPGSGTWYGLSGNASGSFTSTQWGLGTDHPVAADYDGDRKTDLAVWRPESGSWYILPSNSPGAYAMTQWGVSSDLPLPGDYDGDGKMDIAVWRPENGAWYILPTNSPETYTVTHWGTPTDILVPADYDGDGKTDIAVWRPESGSWYILPSGSPGSYNAAFWGIATDTPVPGNYDADGKADLAVWRSSVGIWYVVQSATQGSYMATRWGSPEDIPVAGDYDGDGRDDISVWRPETGVWYILPSSDPGSYLSTRWGTNSDIPISANTSILRTIP